jgi:CRISPR/Cas system-associated protein endoribonuclease Cas2
MALSTKHVGEFTVSQMGTLQMCNFRVYQRQNAQQTEQRGENEGLAEWLNEWAFVAAVTSPQITREQYAEMDLTLARQLVEAAEELNASLAETAPQEKKSKTAKSTKESRT